FSQRQDGMPAIVLDPSCRILADALASRVCYREQVSELEKITVDLVYRPHAFGDIWMALAYLLASNEYMELREFVDSNKHTARNRREKPTAIKVDGAYESTFSYESGRDDEQGNWLRR